MALCALSAFPARAQTDVAVCSEDALIQALDSGDSLVTFSEDCDITLTAPISLYSDLTIDAQGHNVIIRGAGQFQIFDLEPDAPVSITLIGLTLSGGLGTQGGALFIGTNVTMLLTNCTLEGNNVLGTTGGDGVGGSSDPNGNGGDGTSGTSGTFAMGGAIYNLGTLSLLNCSLMTNSASGGNGGNGGNGGDGATGFSTYHGGNGGNGGRGASAYGGAIYSPGKLFLNACIVAGNSVVGGNGGSGGNGGNSYTASFTGSGGTGGAGSGAGIWSGTNLTAVSCTFYDNVARGGDGANGSSATSVGEAGRNGAVGSGGGVFSQGVAAVTNCTFFANTVTGGNGGPGGAGINSLGKGGDAGNGGNGSGGGFYGLGTVFMKNCTVANCSATGGTNASAGGGVFPGDSGSPGAANGGGIAGGGGRFILFNSLLSTNRPGGNGYGAISDGGYNISSDSSLVLGGTSKTKTDPRLVPLASNGGFAPTMALATNSPAVDFIKGSNALANLPATDQRGVPRPLGAAGDVGAFELALAPYIITQPLSQTATNGNSVLFSVTAAGNQPFVYYWRFTGTNVFYGGLSNLVSVSTNFTRSSFSSLQVSGVTITNSGSYSVVVSNWYGTAASIPAVLSVIPYIVGGPTNSEVGLNQHPFFAVTAAADQPLSYYWFLNDTNLVASPPGSSPYYLAPAAQAADDGSTYSVIVSNSVGSVTSAVAVLQVDAPPVLLVQPASQAVALGSQFVFQISAAGHEPLYYQWRLNSNNVASNPLNPNSGIFTAQTDSVGWWDVVVTNSFGSVTSAAAFLTVVTAPPATVTVTPSSQVVTQGQTAAFTAAATGDGLSYQWRRNGSPIAGATSSIFSMGHVQLAQAGEYDVIVSNPLGAITSSPPASLSVVMPALELTNYVSLSVPGFQALGIAVAGNAAYLAMAGTNTSGTPGRLQVVDISNPLNPVATNSISLPGPGLSVFVIGAKAYVACGNAGLQAVDVTDPANPVVGSLFTSSAALSAFITNQYAYVAAGSNGLQIFDLSSSTTTNAVGSVTTNITFAQSVWVSGNHAYVGDDTGLNVIDISSPSNPSWRARVTTGLPVYGLADAGPGALALAADAAGLEIAIINSPEAPGMVATNGAAAPANGVAYSSGYVFVASGTNGLRAFNAINASNPQLAGAAAIGNAGGVDVSGRYAYVAADDGLVVVDAGDPLENAPQFRNQPQDITVAPGSTAVFSVVASGTAPLSYQWSRDGNLLTNATGPVLAIPGAQFADAGSYTVTVSNSVGTVASQSAQLSVACAYLLSADSTNLSFSASTNTFTVTAAGSCEWTATTSDDWIHVISPVGSTNGSATITFSVDVNSDPNFSRTGYILVGSVESPSLFTITQAETPAVYALTVESSNTSGSAATITVTASPADNQGLTSGIAGGKHPLAFAYNDGTIVTLTAPINGASLFREWQIDGLTATTNPTVQISIDGDHTATAVYSPFTAGAYSGLFYDTNGVSPASSGFFKITSTTKGAFSGYLQIGVARYAISGRFDATGTGYATNSAAHRNPSSVSVAMRLDPSDIDRISGTVAVNLTSNILSAALLADRAVFSAKNPAAQKGLYTVGIPGAPDAVDQPGGDSYAKVSISSAGLITLTGSLADNTAISQTATLSKDGFWPFYVPLYNGQGLLLSWLALTNPATGDLSDLNGLNWIKPSVLHAKYYAAGFSVVTNVLGSGFVKPARNVPVLPFTDADIVLTGNNLLEPLTDHVTLNANNTVTSTNKASLSFNLASGSFSGRVLDASKKSITFNGVVLTNLQVGRGYFLGTNQSGSVTFQAR